MKKALIAGMVFFLSCKSTDSINRFAKSASTGTAEINRTVPGFSGICQLYDPAALRVLTDTSLYSKSGRQLTHCGDYKQADSLMNLISRTLTDYFSLLGSVSDKKLLAYNARELVDALGDIQPKVYPALQVNEEKISAIKDLLNTLLNEPLKWYRYNKLVLTMQQNDSALGRVLAAYSFMLDTALNGALDQARENYTSFVYAPLYEWANSPVEKVWVNQQYRQFLLTIGNEKDKIHASVRMLTLIRKDHYMLAYGKPPDGFAYTEAEVSQDIVLLNKMIMELIQLIK